MPLTVCGSSGWGVRGLYCSRIACFGNVWENCFSANWLSPTRGLHDEDGSGWPQRSRTISKEVVNMGSFTPTWLQHRPNSLFFPNQCVHWRDCYGNFKETCVDPCVLLGARLVHPSLLCFRRKNRVPRELYSGVVFCWFLSMCILGGKRMRNVYICPSWH